MNVKLEGWTIKLSVSVLIKSNTDSIFKLSKFGNIFSKTVWSLVKTKFWIKCSITLKTSIRFESFSFVSINGTTKLNPVFWRLKLSVTKPSMLTSALFAAWKEIYPTPMRFIWVQERIERFWKRGTLYVGHHVWPTKKILDFRWSKKAKVTLETKVFGETFLLVFSNFLHFYI